MSVGFIGKSMFVLTKNGYRASASMSESDLVKSFKSGKEVYSQPESISNYSQPSNELMIIAKCPPSLKKDGLLFSVSASQRMFWQQNKSPDSLRIGTAQDFYDSLHELGTLYMVQEDNRVLPIDLDDVSIEIATSGWGVATESGNLVVKADGPALKFCDCG